MTTVTQTNTFVTTQEPTSSNEPERGIMEKLWDYAKSRFNSDNWFGSVILPWALLNGYHSKKSGEKRTEHGSPARDFERKLGAELFMIEKTWSFFSTRGGTFPEGKNFLERALNALKHPLASSTQFEWLLLVFPKLLSIHSNIEKGSRAFGIGLKNGATPYKVERIRIVNGIAQIGAFIFTGYGHFRKHNKKPSTEQVENSNSLQAKPHDKRAHPESTDKGNINKLWNNAKYFVTNIPDITKQMWKKDRLLLVGTLITMFIPSLNTLEGRAKKKIGAADAEDLIKSGQSQFWMNVAYTIYTMQRIAKGNYKTDNAATGADITPEDIEQIEEQRGAIRQPAPVKSFASRFPQASVRNADKAGMALVA